MKISTSTARGLQLLLLIVPFSLVVADDAMERAETRSHKRSGFTRDFHPTDCHFASSGANSYFRLDPGYQLVLEGKEAGHRVRLIVTVLNETANINGAETRIVEEREWQDDKLVEVSRNYFALCTETSDLYYFGEDVDIYKNGQVVSHDGAWHAGVGGARQGVFVPGNPLLGSRYYEEVAPGTALDKGEIAQLLDEVTTRAGTFQNVLFVIETSDLEKGKSTKQFAPGVGLIKDDTIELVEYGFFDHRGSN